jgi:CBS domain-containing protein
MHISEVYRPQLLTCEASDPLPAVAQKMMAGSVGALAVVDGTRIAGIISERDITRAVAENGAPGSHTAAHYASTDLEVATLNDETSQVARRMLEAGVRHLPVIEDNEMIGMVSIRDLLAVDTWA